MRHEDIFLRKTDSEYNFICNRENGKWALTKENSSEELEAILDKTPIEEKPSIGTDLVVLNVGTGCNLDCLYCHLGSEKTESQMNLDIGKKAIDKISELSQPNPEIIFHGGEPLRYYPLIKKLVKYAREKGIEKFGVQTNGTLITDEILDFFSKNGVGIGISLDGFEKHQNKTRRYINGKFTYQIVMENIPKVIDKLGGLSIISVVTSHNVPDLNEIAEGFEDMGIDSVRFSPVYPTSSNLDYSPNLEIFSKSMIEVFDNYLDKLVAREKPIKILNLQGLMRTLFSEKKTYNCTKCGNGDRQPLIGIDVDGLIYPCDFFWGKENYKIGSIDSDNLMESINSSRNIRSYRSIDSLEDCVACDWKLFCGSGCPGSSVVAGKGLVQKDPYCQFNKDMLEYVVSKLPEIYNEGILREVLGEPKNNPA